MADPICRWRNTTPDTVKLLVKLLPKQEMAEALFREELKKNCQAENFDYDSFVSTAYQLAVQIGLYYISEDGVYHPRFRHELTDEESAEYVVRVAALYVSPNPYTKSMVDAGASVCLYDYFVQCASRSLDSVFDVKAVLEGLYKLPIGNTDMIVNLMARTGAFEKIDGQHLKYVGRGDAAKDRDTYFKHFGALLKEGLAASVPVSGKGLLRVGDVFSGKDGGVFTVVEVLPKVYRIRAEETKKIRSVPKTVVAAWYEFYKTHPTVDYDQKKTGGGVVHKAGVPIRDAATRPLRDLINTTTEDDSYEHGYDGMLGSIARWLLDNPREEVEETPDPQPIPQQPTLSRREQFINWMIDSGKDRGYAEDSAGSCLISIDDEYEEKQVSVWHGLREAMYGTPSPVGIYLVKDSVELMKYYGGLDALFEKKECPAGIDVAKYKACYDWCYAPANHSGVKSAFKLYRKFMEWYDAQQVEAPQAVEPEPPATPQMEFSPKIVDFAVKLFRERRLDEAWTGQLKKDGYEGLHARYEAMNPETLRNMSPAEFDAWVDRELWAARTFFCGQNIKKLSDPDKAEFCRFIAATKKNFRLMSSYFGRDAVLPNGVGPVVATELLMKFHPQDYCSYNILMLQGLKVLGLVASDKMPNAPGVLDYQKLMGHAAMLLEKLTAAQVPRRFDEASSVAPDYITVNEFLWWCKAHREDILTQHWEKHMKTEIKKVEQKEIGDFSEFVKKVQKDVSDAGLVYAPDLMKRFVCAQLAKPFVVLTGLSGSGKTKLAQAFTRWLGVKDTYKVVPVGADWTNNEKLLGYPNALDPQNYVMPDTGVLKLMIDAKDNPGLPFFLILDEMNLSHVERYFADFLSAMESHESMKLYDGELRTATDGTPIPQTLAVPENLFVIGTMNVDETTYMFSPKVLDRAQVIEFRVSPKEMGDFLSAPSNPDMSALEEKGAAYAGAFLELARARAEKKPAEAEVTALRKVLNDVFPALADLGAEFGYRSAIEIVTFVAYYLEASGYGAIASVVEKKKCLEKGIDAAILQKLLPKLHGSLNRLGPVLDALIGKVSSTRTDQNGETEITKIYPLTFEKLTRMKDRVEKNGFTSFAEA